MTKSFNADPLQMFLKLCLFVLTLVIWVTGCTSQGSSDWKVRIGDPIPEFSLKDLNGEGSVTNTSLSGKPYVLSVFATWCPPCREELLALNEAVWKPLNEKGVQVIAVNFGDEEDELIKQFVTQNDLAFPVLADPTGSLRKELGVEMVPQAVVVGPEGKIIDLHVGVTPETISSIAETLQSALN